MKKIITVILAAVLCLPVMSVMASERSVSEGGLTLTVPSGYTAYTQEEAAAASAKKYGGYVNDVADLFDLNIWVRIAGDLVAGLASEAVTEVEYEDDLELVISDDSIQHIFKIYAQYGAVNYSFADHAYYEYRITFGPIWSTELSGEGYTSDISDLIMCQTQNGLPYAQLDGYSDSNGCCRMAVFMDNGYFDRIIYIDKTASTLSESSIATFNELINSVSIAVSPYEIDEIRGAQKYGSILYHRVELTD